MEFGVLASEARIEDVMLYYPKTPMEVDVVRDWVRERIDVTDMFLDGYAMAIVEALEDGDAIIRAGFIFTNYSGTNVFVSGASDTDGFMAPTEVAKALMTPFLPPLSVLRMTALVSETNKRSQELMKTLGFVHEGTLRDYEAEGTTTLVFGLTKADFFGGRYGKRCKATAVRYESEYRDDGERLAVCGGILGHDGDVPADSAGGRSGDGPGMGSERCDAAAGGPVGSGEPEPLRSTA